MSSQIFKNEIPNSLLMELLDIICVKNNNSYVFDFIAFKKGIYNENIQQFLKDCIPYYHVSKRIYLEKNISYKSFTTVLRQICNYNKIPYTSQIKYDKSKYEIIYYINYI